MSRFAVPLSKPLVTPLFAAALLALLLFPVLTLAQDPPAESPKHALAAEQMDIFRASLQLLKFTPVKRFADLKPENCILVMFGDTRRLTEVPGGLRSFLEQGGAAFIASDKPMQDGPKKALVDVTGVSITGYFLDVDSSPNAACYRDLNYCPWMESRDPRFMNHPITGQKLRVATNMPSTLDIEGRASRVPYFATLPGGRIGPIFLVPKSVNATALDPLFGVAGDVEKGRIIVLADHSIFINEMMKPTDNNNVEFTANCLAYLRGETGQRKHVLFVDDGVIYPSFGGGPRLPSLGDLLGRLLNKAEDRLNSAEKHLNELDETDNFNRRLGDGLASMGWGRVRRMLVIALILGTLMLLMYGCYRLGIASRYHQEVGVPSVARATRSQAPGGSLIELRHDGLLDAGNIWEAGRQLARDAFEASGVKPPVPYREPRVMVQQGWWWQRNRTRNRVRWLWRLAFRAKPMLLAPGAILALAAELEALKVELERGTIQLG